MPASLSEVSASPMIREYAQGAAQSAVMPVASFLAPTVDVPTSVGRYKVYDEKHRFALPDTRRAIGGRAVTLHFDQTDATYNCEPHAIDYPVDRLEQLEQAGLENALQEGATAVAEVAGLSHEKDVIDDALTALGAGTNLTWDGSADPITDLDERILTVIKAAKYGSLMGVGVLFGATAWKITKNQAAVRGRYIVGNKTKTSNTQTPTIGEFGSLLLAEPKVNVSLMVYDTAKEGLAESIDFVLDDSIIVFATKEQPTRRDPSFMKTFRLMGNWMVPGSYVRDDDRVEVAKFDWSEDVVVTNSEAGVRLNIAAS